MLEYDNSAFYYFAITMLIIYVLPGTWYAVAEFAHAFFGSGEIGAKARSKYEQEKAQRLKKQTTGWTRLNTTGYITNLILIVCAWCLLFYCLAMVINDGEVNSFDPYQILGIEQGATLSIIKKAYRGLSLKYHPDRNQGNKAAGEMFIKIAKAYEALTDETSKENYKKYGNPDGKQSLEVSIGLPKILLENPKVVLVLYLIAMVVVIPAVVGLWYANSKQFGEKNILYDTYNTFYSLLQDSHKIKNLVEVLSASAEARQIFTTNSDKLTSNPDNTACIEGIFEKVKKDKVMVRPKYEAVKVLWGNLLLHAHALRLSIAPPTLKKAQNDLLKRVPELVEGLVEIAQHRKWLEVALSAIKLGQCLVQGVFWGTSDTPSATQPDPFLQLPGLNESDTKKMRGATNGRPFREFLRLNKEDRFKALLTALGGNREDEVKELVEVCELFPRLEIAMKLFVEEEEEENEDGDKEDNKDKKKEEKKAEAEETATAVVGADINSKPAAAPKGDCIYEQDLVTLRLTLTRSQLPETSKKIAPVHAPLFPSTLFEGWWVLLLDKSNGSKEPAIHAFEHLTDRDRVLTHEIRFMAPPKAGSYELELSIFCDSYLGLDETRKVSFEVRPAAELPEYVPHQEDLDLDNEPTLFEQMAAANLDDSSDDEDDDDEEKENNEEDGADSKQAKKKLGKGKAVVKEEKAQPADVKSSSSGSGRSKKTKGGKQQQVVVEDASDEDEED